MENLQALLRQMLNKGVFTTRDELRGFLLHLRDTEIPALEVIMKEVQQGSTEIARVIVEKSNHPAVQAYRESLLSPQEKTLKPREQRLRAVESHWIQHAIERLVAIMKAKRSTDELDEAEQHRAQEIFDTIKDKIRSAKSVQEVEAIVSAAFESPEPEAAPLTPAEPAVTPQHTPETPAGATTTAVPTEEDVQRKKSVAKMVGMAFGGWAVESAQNSSVGTVIDLLFTDWAHGRDGSHGEHHSLEEGDRKPLAISKLQETLLAHVGNAERNSATYNRKMAKFFSAWHERMVKSGVHFAEDLAEEVWENARVGKGAEHGDAATLAEVREMAECIYNALAEGSEHHGTKEAGDAMRSLNLVEGADEEILRWSTDLQDFALGRDMFAYLHAISKDADPYRFR
jgi:hypothetical protein